MRQLVVMATLLAVFAVGCDEVDSLGKAPQWFVSWLLVGVAGLWWVSDRNREKVITAIDSLKDDLKSEIENLTTAIDELTMRLQDGVSNDELFPPPRPNESVSDDDE